MKKLPSLSLFFPCLNDGNILPSLMRKTYAIIPKITSDFEVTVVDDGSTDETHQVLRGLSAHYPHFKVIRHHKNLGYGAALASGFKSATKEWVFYTDGDGQYDPSEITQLVRHITDDVDVVNGFKLGREDALVRKVIGSLNNWMLHIMFSLPISDIDCDFRLIKKSLLDKIELTSISGTICVELVVKLQRIGAHFAEVGVHHYRRPYGKSQFFRLERIAKTVKDNITFYASQKI